MRYLFFFQAEDGIRDKLVTGVQTCALPISSQSLRVASSLDTLSVMWRLVVRLRRYWEASPAPIKQKSLSSRQRASGWGTTRGRSTTFVGTRTTLESH